MESTSNGSKECFSIRELSFGLSSRFSGPEYLWNSDSISGAGMQHGHTWELYLWVPAFRGSLSPPTCPVRVRVTCLLPIFLLLKCNAFSSSKGKIYPACWTGYWEKWKKSLWLFSLLWTSWNSGGSWQTLLCVWRTLTDLATVFHDWYQDDL